MLISREPGNSLRFVCSERGKTRQKLSPKAEETVEIFAFGKREKQNAYPQFNASAIKAPLFE